MKIICFAAYLITGLGLQFIEIKKKVSHSLYIYKYITINNLYTHIFIYIYIYMHIFICAIKRQVVLLKSVSLE